MPLLSPCATQTEKEVEAYYCKAQVGSLAAVRDTRWQLLQYSIVPIGNIDRVVGTIHVAYGVFFIKNGKRHAAPAGQVSLVVPTNAVIRWAREHPQGEKGYSIFTEERASFFSR
jgi:hypothetical protein